MFEIFEHLKYSDKNFSFSYVSMKTWGTSNEYPQYTCMFSLRHKINIGTFPLEKKQQKKQQYVELYDIVIVILSCMHLQTEPTIRMLHT